MLHKNQEGNGKDDLDMVQAGCNSPDRPRMSAILSIPIGDGFVRKDFGSAQSLPRKYRWHAHRLWSLI